MLMTLDYDDGGDDGDDVNLRWWLEMMWNDDDGDYEDDDNLRWWFW